MPHEEKLCLLPKPGRLAARLLLGEVPDNRQLVPLAFTGLQNDEEPNQEESCPDSEMDQREQKNNPGDEVHRDLHDRDDRLDKKPSDEESDRLPGVEAD